MLGIDPTILVEHRVMFLNQRLTQSRIEKWH